MSWSSRANNGPARAAAARTEITRQEEKPIPLNGNECDGERNAGFLTIGFPKIVLGTPQTGPGVGGTLDDLILGRTSSDYNQGEMGVVTSGQSDTNLVLRSVEDMRRDQET